MDAPFSGVFSVTLKYVVPLKIIRHFKFSGYLSFSQDLPLKINRDDCKHSSSITAQRKTNATPCADGILALNLSMKNNVPKVTISLSPWG